MNIWFKIPALHVNTTYLKWFKAKNFWFLVLAMLESAKRSCRFRFHCAHLKCTFMMKYHTLNMLLGHSSSRTKLFRIRGFQKRKVHSYSSKDLWFTASQSLTHLAMRPKTGNFEEFVDKLVEPPTLTCCNFEVFWYTGVCLTFSETFKPK